MLLIVNFILIYFYPWFALPLKNCNFMQIILRVEWTELYQIWEWRRAIIPALQMCLRFYVRFRINCCNSKWSTQRWYVLKSESKFWTAWPTIFRRQITHLTIRVNLSSSAEVLTADIPLAGASWQAWTLAWTFLLLVLLMISVISEY